MVRRPKISMGQTRNSYRNEQQNTTTHCILQRAFF